MVPISRPVLFLFFNQKIYFTTEIWFFYPLKLIDLKYALWLVTLVILQIVLLTTGSLWAYVLIMLGT